jgi:hypothetical protein
MYILKLLLNVVTTEIEALLVLGSKVLYACVKEICHLQAQPHFDTFHHSIMLKCYDPNQLRDQDCRRMVRQLPVEMLWMLIVMEEHLCQMAAFHVFSSAWPYTVLFSVSQYTSGVIVVPCCMNSTISTHFLSQKTVIHMVVDLRLAALVTTKKYK